MQGDFDLYGKEYCMKKARQIIAARTIILDDRMIGRHEKFKAECFIHLYAAPVIQNLLEKYTNVQSEKGR